MKTLADHGVSNEYGAFIYVWDHSQSIREWYITEHNFSADQVNGYNYRTTGGDDPGDLVSEIINDGLKDGLILVDCDGVYWGY